jgi:hypothetical protein
LNVVRRIVLRNLCCRRIPGGPRYRRRQSSRLASKTPRRRQSRPHSSRLTAGNTSIRVLSTRNLEGSFQPDHREPGPVHSGGALGVGEVTSPAHSRAEVASKPRSRTPLRSSVRTADAGSCRRLDHRSSIAPPHRARETLVAFGQPIQPTHFPGLLPKLVSIGCAQWKKAPIRTCLVDDP